jgi:hypothetical protein
MVLVSWVRFAFAASVAGLSASSALGAPQPVFGPPAAWVEMAPVPPPPPADGGAAVQMVLDDNQTRLTSDGDA